MRLTRPANATFLVAAVLGLLAILGAAGVVAQAAPYATWLAIGGWALLSVGCLARGL
ncbi:MAG: hypothetical protein KDK12_14150 [Rhodobacteraceae bacterium]|nr:hypothetical protein [Paracoccaceae bacterium]